MIGRGRKDPLPTLRNVPKEKLLEEIAKVDKALSKFKTDSITKTQNQSIKNLVNAKIDKSQGDSLRRVCRKVDESIDHIVSGCSKLAQKE